MKPAGKVLRPSEARALFTKLSGKIQKAYLGPKATDVGPGGEKSSGRAAEVGITPVGTRGSGGRSCHTCAEIFPAELLSSPLQVDQFDGPRSEALGRLRPKRRQV